MGVKQNIFGSISEQKNYYKLSREWSRDYKIYHNIPFLNIFFLDDEVRQKLKLSEYQIDFLKKTSVDYTLCDQKDRPIVCIEFDGLNHGFSMGTKYYPEQGSNPLRQKGFNLKLQVSHRFSFPFFIVRAKEFENLYHNIKLTIIDGIIGQIIAHKVFQSKIQQPFNPENMAWI